MPKVTPTMQSSQDLDPGPPKPTLEVACLSLRSLSPFIPSPVILAVQLHHQLTSMQESEITRANKCTKLISSSCEIFIVSSASQSRKLRHTEAKQLPKRIVAELRFKLRTQLPSTWVALQGGLPAPQPWTH